MVVYNVTINVHESAHVKWLQWMKDVHLPKVMDTKMFRSYSIFKLLTRQDDEEGVTYCIQYFCDNEANYDNYKTNFAPTLQAETQQLFAGQFHAFRTLMEEV